MNALNDKNYVSNISDLQHSGTQYEKVVNRFYLKLAQPNAELKLGTFDGIKTIEDGALAPSLKTTKQKKRRRHERIGIRVFVAHN